MYFVGPLCGSVSMSVVLPRLSFRSLQILQRLRGLLSSSAAYTANTVTPAAVCVCVCGTKTETANPETLSGIIALRTVAATPFSYVLCCGSGVLKPAQDSGFLVLGFGF